MRLRKTSAILGAAGLDFTLLSFRYLSVQAQTPTKPGPPASAQPPVATAGVHKKVLDSENRPITAGGTVEDGPMVFLDTAESAGLTAWKHVMGTPERKFILETVGSGVALLDYDNDGWLDIYLV